MMICRAEQRLQCGVVYTWNCAGELYAIECALCEERPLCTLAEFAEHMEIWHSTWETDGQLEAQVADEHDELMQEVLAELNDAGNLNFEHVEDVIVEEVPDDIVQPIEIDIESAMEVEEALQSLTATKVAQLPRTMTANENIEKGYIRECILPKDSMSKLESAADGDVEQQVPVISSAGESKTLMELLQDRHECNIDEMIAANEDVIATEQVPSGVLSKAPHNEVAIQETLLANKSLENSLDSNLLRVLPAESVVGLSNERKPNENDNDGSNETDAGAQEIVAHTSMTQTQSLDHAAADHKLTTLHVAYLIELYKVQPRLWNQSHVEFRDTELCRRAWQEITTAWNAHCQRDFSTAEVRIRVSTLCQRFMKQRERLEAEGELDECAKFVHYDRLMFLLEQQTLQHRRADLERENRKLIEIYKQYPVIWHTGHKYARCRVRREAAYADISKALQLCGISLSGLTVQRRLQTLRKCYRLEKIRYLHSLVEASNQPDNLQPVAALVENEFVSEFTHYGELAFLHRHIDPYVCADCGKIFENLISHRDHVNNWHQGSWPTYDDGEEAKTATSAPKEVQQRPTQTPVEQIQAETIATVDELAFSQAEPTTVQSEKASTQNDNEHDGTPQALVCAELSVHMQRSPSNCRPLLQTEKTAASAQESSAKCTEQTATEDSEVADTTCSSIEDAIVGALSKEDSNQHSVDSSADSGPSMLHLAQKNRLSVPQTHKLIALYKAHPTLWDPNHLDYHSRKQRQIAWRTLAAQLSNSDAVAGKCRKRFTWQMLHRKLTDYTKYYRREKQRLTEAGLAESNTKWCFYKDFQFLDDVLVITSELQKTLQQRDNNLRIIELYKAYPQLWCTNHPDYTKRKQRQQYTESMCTRLQEECNIQITAERLKTRLIEFRCQYRQAKEQRIQAAAAAAAAAATVPVTTTNGSNCSEVTSWRPNFSYYEVLHFLDAHVSPFACAHCPTSFKRRTDYLQHERNVHGTTANSDKTPLGIRRRSKASIKNSIHELELEHICHVCGLKFSTRNNLLAHLKRHLGQRNHACSECPKKFFNTTALRVHMRSHTKELPYVCEHCARGFVNASKLNQHIKRHRNQRDFPCERCDKAFYSAFERDRHLRCHLKIRDKVCPICDRAFVVGSAYYAHMNLHRESKRYACENCDQRFAQYAGLYKHRKRCTAGALASD